MCMCSYITTFIVVCLQSVWFGEIPISRVVAGRFGLFTVKYFIV